MTFLVFSVFPAPDSPLWNKTQYIERLRQIIRISQCHDPKALKTAHHNSQFDLFSHSMQKYKTRKMFKIELEA